MESLGPSDAELGNTGLPNIWGTRAFICFFFEGVGNLTLCYCWRRWDPDTKKQQSWRLGVIYPTPHWLIYTSSLSEAHLSQPNNKIYINSWEKVGLRRCTGGSVSQVDFSFFGLTSLLYCVKQPQTRFKGQVFCLISKQPVLQCWRDTEKRPGDSQAGRGEGQSATINHRPAGVDANNQ